MGIGQFKPPPGTHAGNKPPRDEDGKVASWWRFGPQTGNKGQPAINPVLTPKQDQIPEPELTEEQQQDLDDNDLSGAGIGEETAEEVVADLDDPTAIEDQWESVEDMFAEMPETSQHSQQAVADFNESVPADMSQYYSNAMEQATSEINQQMAARGLFGSSAAAGMIADATSNLAAERALKEAEYGLSRADLQGKLSGQADSSDIESSKNQLQWLLGGSEVAGEASQASLNRLLAKAGVAKDGQILQEGRVQDMLGHVGGRAAEQAKLIADMSANEISNLIDLLESQTSLDLGMWKDKLAGGAEDREEAAGIVSMIMALWG